MDLIAFRNMARSTMDSHGLWDWHLQFDGGKRRFGVTKYGPQVLSFSRHIVPLRNEDDCQQVVLHEIAHVIAGHDAGHGPLWQKVAADIGCIPTRCIAPTNPEERVKRNWRAFCTDGGHWINVERFRRPKNGKGHTCVACAKAGFPGRVVEWKAI